MQKVLDSELEFDSVRASLQFEDSNYALDGSFRGKSFQVELEVFFLEESVVKEIVDEVQEEKRL